MRMRSSLNFSVWRSRTSDEAINRICLHVEYVLDANRQLNSIIHNILVVND